MNTNSTTEIALPYDDAEQQRSAAKLGMWIFLATEVLFFGGLFVGYAVYRYEYFDDFEAGSRELNLWTGAVMTAVLLLGSLLVAVSDHLMEQNNGGDNAALRHSIVQRLTLTAILGLLFLGLEFWEYSELINDRLFPGETFVVDAGEFPVGSAGPSWTIQMFFVLFFCMTGLHACHMVIGISLVTWMAVTIHHSERPRRHLNALTVVGLYWHFVDIVWIFLYPLFYLVR